MRSEEQHRRGGGNLTTLASKIGGILTVATVALSVAATPANAQTGWDRCAHGNFCLFEDGSGQGRMYILITPDSSTRRNIPDDFNDKTSSVWNRGGQQMTLFRDAGCQNVLFLYRPYGPPHDLVHTRFNDQATSTCAS